MIFQFNITDQIDHYSRGTHLPEYPDIVVYIERLKTVVCEKVVIKIRNTSLFFLRTAIPPLDTIVGKKIVDIYRLGKRIVFVFPDELFLVLHLMIAGRLHWREPGSQLNKKTGLASLDFQHGSLMFTESGTKKRASLHLVLGENNLEQFRRSGLNVLEIDLDQFASQIRLENHTLKRALTDPQLFDGIGNAYSDEILFNAGLSPVKWTLRLSDNEIEKLYHACRNQLIAWTNRLRSEAGDTVPEKVTAFHKEMAVHGKYNQPCPVCKTLVQRIRYADNETNYCPRCQTNGVLLSDRGLSRLLKNDWPKTIDELENSQRNLS